MGSVETIERYGDGDIIIRQGQIGDCMYIVRSGSVQIFRTLVGADTILADLHEGDFFGEMALFDHRPRSASARAAGSTELAVVTEADYAARKCDPLLRDMLEVLARRLRAVDDAYERASAQGASERERLATLWKARDWTS